jgi:hypothetical protein
MLALSSLMSLTANATDPVSATAEAIIPVFSIGITFTMTAVIVGSALYASYRKQRLKYDAIRFAIEKGVAVPEDLLRDHRPTTTSQPTRDLRRGLVLVGLGAGLALFLRILDGTSANGVWSVGFVPLLLGAGFLVTWYMTRREGLASAVRE